MTRKLLSMEGISADVTLNPAPGFKWILKEVILVLITSSTAGSREVWSTITRGANTTWGQNYNGSAARLADTGSITTVSTTKAASGGTIVGETSTAWYKDQEVSYADNLQILMSLQTGDKVQFYITLDEVGI